jgi:hypothetical protein
MNGEWFRFKELYFYFCSLKKIVLALCIELTALHSPNVFCQLSMSRMVRWTSSNCISTGTLAQTVSLEPKQMRPVLFVKST